MHAQRWLLHLVDLSVYMCVYGCVCDAVLTFPYELWPVWTHIIGMLASTMDAWYRKETGARFLRLRQFLLTI